MPGIRVIVDKAEYMRYWNAGYAFLFKPLKSTVTTIVAEIRGLTMTEADALEPTEGWKITSRRPSGQVFWTVTEEQTVYGEPEDA